MLPESVTEETLNAVRRITLGYLAERGITLQEWDRLTDLNDPSLDEHFDHLIERFRPLLPGRDQLRSEDVTNIVMNRSDRAERYRKLLDGVEKVEGDSVHISVKEGLTPVEVDEFRDIMETGAKRLLGNLRGYGCGKGEWLITTMMYPAATSTIDYLLRRVRQGIGTDNFTAKELLDRLPGIIDELETQPEALEARCREYLEVADLPLEEMLKLA
jgi:hypothetical protein